MHAHASTPCICHCRHIILLVDESESRMTQPQEVAEALDKLLKLLDTLSPIAIACCSKESHLSITIPSTVALDMDRTGSFPILTVGGLCSLSLTVMMHDLANENFSRLRPPQFRIRCKGARDRPSISARIYTSTRTVMSSA
ncbi:hypothetical protein EVAR_59019_1 [Eumeta japonica]|uniref:Uncharacterized protein n=1 Tax=Eumeta variegata TaxID=151549 RepID=A0A4C1ZL96_EUMVA|nr:hypothetical protein EVAR_59019_1 [Eumeta japonica]